MSLSVSRSNRPAMPLSLYGRRRAALVQFASKRLEVR